MQAPLWVRLGLSREEWDDCRVAAFEMSLGSGARVPARQVAVEFALARGFDAPRAERAWAGAVAPPATRGRHAAGAVRVSRS